MWANVGAPTREVHRRRSHGWLDGARSHSGARRAGSFSYGPRPDWALGSVIARNMCSRGDAAVFDEVIAPKRCIVTVNDCPRRGDGARMNTPNSEKPGGSKPVVVKKYANRRLYNTATSSYVTLDDLAKLIKEGGDFVAHDAKTGEDITRSVLTQIIVEQEQKGQNLLPISFLRQLIGFYGDSMQFLVPGYLEQAMGAFGRNQEQMRKSLQATFGIFPFGQFEEMGKQNMALFQRALDMLAPYGHEEKPPSPDTGASRAKDEDPRLKRLEAQINALTQQLKALGRDRGEP